jgi:hypothetical protein
MKIIRNGAIAPELASELKGRTALASKFKRAVRSCAKKPA